MAKQDYIARHEVKALAQTSDLAGALLVLHCWGTIVLMMAMFVIWPNFFTFIIAFSVISGRQLGIAILMHDASHGILFKSDKLNAFVGQYLLGVFIGVELNAYRKYHLKHHRFTQQDKDPDLGLSAAFPATKLSLVRKVLRDLSGLTGLKLRIGQLYMTFRKSPADETTDQAFKVKSIALTYAANFILFLACYLVGYWWVYFALWLLPLLTGFQLVLRIRNIAEHAMTAKTDNPLTHARTTKANIVARILVAPYWVNYHVEHHAYMYIPCWRLRKLHKAMLRNGHVKNMEIKNSYLDVFRTVVSV
ncbi:MAG: fatty acid desaturase [Robiginitomaculum sp.]|nr:MAG: fatty acid desaturase [Robiginitomaculum sp.]